MTRQTQSPLNSAMAEYGDTQFVPPNGPAAPVIDMHRVQKTGNVPENVDAGELKGALMDVGRWLPFASEVYNISHDVRDYVLTPTLIFATEIPNANLCAFPFEEMSRWNVGAGDLSYRTWCKKPCHQEHANSDPTIAKGAIFDASMKPAPDLLGGLYRVVLLSGWDRSRDPALAAHIATGRTGFSMGSWVEKYCCSICGSDIHRSNNGQGCEHYHPQYGPRVREVGGQLVYRIARGVTGFELSSVRTPAYRAAMAESIG